MIAFLSSFVGLSSIGLALIALVVDGTKSIAASQLTITQLGQTWFDLSRSSLTAFQSVVHQDVETYIGPWVWDPVIQSILSLPTWLVFGALGAGLVWLGQPQRGRRRAWMG